MGEKKERQEEGVGREGVRPESFRAMYRGGSAPWEIGKPQPAVVEWIERGMFEGSVVDLGCGSGENALFLAGSGMRVTGLDSEEIPLEEARKKAEERGVSAEFFQENLLGLTKEYPRFDNALDSGLFHSFSDGDRLRYERVISSLLREGGRFFLLAFTPKTAGTRGPRRVTEEEIRSVFFRGWEVCEIREMRFETNDPSWEVFAWGAVLEKRAG